MKKILTILPAALLVSSLHAADEQPKRTLAKNMMLTYNKLPGEAKTFGEMFSGGEWYGRVRSNTFYWDWSDAAGTDNHAWGIGGSLVYKTAKYHGFGATLGAYYSNASLWSMDQADISALKAGKDTLARLSVKNDNKYDMFSLAQASIDYTTGKTTLKVGHQIIESMFTKSNDTKMIPNTFEAAVLENKDIEGTTIRLAHITKQKLRDHTAFHDVITFKDANGESWANNDDSAVHKGLSYANFVAAGKDPEHTMSIAEVHSKFGKNVKTKIAYLMLPDVLTNLAVEAHYTAKAGDTKIIPGFRYMQQMDNGGGLIGGASLAGDLNATNQRGYTNYDSLDSSLLALRVDFQPKGNYKYRLGYSEIADEADIVAPWRGFPTGGFTRAMGQYNWYANTKTYMARIDGKISKNISFLARYVVQGFDEAKNMADSSGVHTDWFFNLNGLAKGLELKLRALWIDSDSATASYEEYRAEFNYLF